MPKELLKLPHLPGERNPYLRRERETKRKPLALLLNLGSLATQTPIRINFDSLS